MDLEPLPPGYAYVTARTTYLEMARPTEPEEPTELDGFAIERWAAPPSDQYRELFRTVGGPWGWTGRLLMPEAELRAILDDPGLEVWRIRVDGEVAGFLELDAREPSDVEIVYFGFREGFTGRGLGGKVLRWAAGHVWSRPETKRFWLHTCDFDHPKALAVSLRAGFRVTGEHVGPEAYPIDYLAGPGRTIQGPS